VTLTLHVIVVFFIAALALFNSAFHGWNYKYDCKECTSTRSLWTSDSSIQRKGWWTT